MKKLPWGRIVTLVALFGGVGLVTWQGIKKKEPPPVAVEVVVAGRQTVVRKVTSAGKVQPQTQVKISSAISGDLLALRVREGDRVRRGQLLGQIDLVRYRAVVKREEAALSGARADGVREKARLDKAGRDAGRIADLVARGLASQAELDAAQTEVEIAQAAWQASEQRAAQAVATLDEARSSLSKTTLYSPIDGTVIALNKEVGERVRGSDFNEDVVMIVAAMGVLEVRVEVGEHDVILVKKGQAAEVEVDAIPNKKFAAEVIEVAQNAIVKNPGTEAEVTSFPVTAILKEPVPGALPGMSATLTISTETRENVIAVPIQCVSARPESELVPGPKKKEQGPPRGPGAKRAKEKTVKVVFVSVDGVARIRKVETGISSDVTMEITDGLREGEKVISGPYRAVSKELEDGARIKIKEEGETGRGERKRPS